MTIDLMDEQLINIYNIRNLEYIKFWDLYGTNDSKMLVIPALMISYDGGKILNLCAKDKYFDTYVKKVLEVYHDEKNNVLEDSLTDPFKLRQSISVDERTKKIISSGILENINRLYSFYEGKETYDSSLLFQIDEVKSLLPIIKYHLLKLFKMTDVFLSIDEDIIGYRSYYTMTGKLNGLNKYFILSFIKVDNNSYEIGIQGLMDKGIPVNMNINFFKDSIVVDIMMGASILSSSSEYLITNEVVKERHLIKKDGVPIGYENRDLIEGINDISNITDIDTDTRLKWFKLPWGAMYGIDNKIIEVSDIEKVIERHNMFVQPNEDNFIMREYFSKSYHRNKTTSVDAIDVTLDEVRKNISCVCIDSSRGIYIMESWFSDRVDKSGYYDEKLAGNYFYHLGESTEGIKGLSRDGLIPISKINNILSGADLFNKANVYRLVKGE